MDKWATTATIFSIFMSRLSCYGICLLNTSPIGRYRQFWKRNKKFASTSRLRMLPGVSLDMAWVVRFAHQPHLVEEAKKTGERTTGMHSNLFVTLPAQYVPRAWM